MKKEYSTRRNVLSSSAIILALMLLFAVNIFANYAFTSTRLDLTENKLYTLSEGTKNILTHIGEPITLRFYYSKSLATGLASINSYALQVRELLQEYQRLSNGKIHLKIIDPEPFSEQEDIAIGYGLQGIPLNESGSAFYFGLAGSSSTNIEKYIPFFNQERESFLEYDITQMIYQLMHPNKPTIGVITSLPMQGQAHGFMGQGGQPAWAIWDQLSQFFNLEMLPADIERMPDDMDLLMLAAPSGLTEKTLYAIDQYVMNGGHMLAFLDTYSETSGRNQPVDAADIEKMNRLLTAWGVTLEAEQVVADRAGGKQVWFQKEARQVLVEYPFWFDINASQMDKHDLVTGDLEVLTLSTAGYFVINDSVDNRIVPLLQSSKEATAFSAKKVQSYQGEPQQIMRDYKENDKVYPVALRLSGKAQSAFPAGQPLGLLANSKIQNNNKHPHRTNSSADINVLLVSDADMLHDRFWLRSQNFLGQQLIMPVSSNGSFVLNAADNLTGSSDLISVRSRGKFTRPFTKLREIQQVAEQKFRSTEQELLDRLQETEARLEKMDNHSIEGNKLILSTEQKVEIERFRQEQVQIRKQLRTVQHELQKDIESMTDRIKAINIGLMPFLVAMTGIALSYYRRKTRPAQ